MTKSRAFIRVNFAQDKYIRHNVKIEIEKGYYSEINGLINEEMIRKYIQEQEEIAE